MRRLLTQRDWQVDPRVWTIEWGVQIEPVGSGAEAVKYLGPYVARTAIGDLRILAVAVFPAPRHLRAHGDPFNRPHRRLAWVLPSASGGLLPGRILPWESPRASPQPLSSNTSAITGR